MNIRDICTVKTGYAFRSKIEHNPDGNIPVIQPKDITNDGRLETSAVVRVLISAIKPTHLLTTGDVLLASRGRFVATTYNGNFDAECVASGALLVLSVKNSQIILPDYLSLYFNSDRGNHQFHRLTERSTIPSLNRSTLEEMEIPVPDIGTQKKLIALERAKQRYGQLTKRKQELLNHILNHQLSSIG